MALAINLALSFGHTHDIDGKATGPGIAAMAAAIAPSHDGQRQHHPGDRHSDDLCPICMAAIAIGNGVASVPPALPLQSAAITLDRTIEAVAGIPDRPRTAFQSRGPPLS